MTYDEIARSTPVTQERLARFLPLKRELENQTERIARARSASVNSSAPVGGAFGGRGYPSDKVGTAVVNIVELEEKWQESIEEIKAEAVALEEAIQLLTDPEEREILRLRYFDGLTLEECGDRLNCEKTKSAALHKSAIKSVETLTNPWQQVETAVMKIFGERPRTIMVPKK